MPNFLSGPAAEVRQGLMEAGSAASAASHHLPIHDRSETRAVLVKALEGSFNV